MSAAYTQSDSNAFPLGERGRPLPLRVPHRMDRMRLQLRGHECCAAASVTHMPSPSPAHSVVEAGGAAAAIAAYVATGSLPEELASFSSRLADLELIREHNRRCGGTFLTYYRTGDAFDLGATVLIAIVKMRIRIDSLGSAGPATWAGSTRIHARRPRCFFGASPCHRRANPESRVCMRNEPARRPCHDAGLVGHRRLSGGRMEQYDAALEAAKHNALSMVVDWDRTDIAMWVLENYSVRVPPIERRHRRSSGRVCAVRAEINTRGTSAQ